MSKKIIQQEEADARHDAAKHISRDTTTAKMQVGKGQCQHHHHQAAQRVKNFTPKLDFIALGRLLVGLQMLDVLEQIDCAHALRFEECRRHHLGADLVRPDKAFHFQQLDLGVRLVPGREYATNHTTQAPGIVGIYRRLFSLRHGHQEALVVKLKHAHPMQTAIGFESTDVDRVLGMQLSLLQPGTGLSGRDSPLVTSLQKLRGAVCHRCQIVANRNGQNYKNQSKLQQRAKGPPGPKAAGAQDGVLRTSGKTRHDKDGANQHCNRQQFVQMCGYHEYNIAERVNRLIGGDSGSTDRLQLFDKIEKKEQADKAKGDKANCPQHL